MAQFKWNVWEQDLYKGHFYGTFIIFIYPAYLFVIFRYIHNGCDTML